MQPISNSLINKITGRAPLKLSVISHNIIGFTVLGRKDVVCKKLIAAGYEAEEIGYGFIRVKNVIFDNPY